MATIEFCPENSGVQPMSPRISFSHDLSQMDSVPVEQYIRSSSPSSIDFDFCVFRQSFDLESSSADELFYDGKILPIEIKKKLLPPKNSEPPLAPPPPPPPRQPENSKRVVLESEEKQNPKSFWRFKRSTSLNCGSGYATTLCPLPLLSRSNSTGSSTPSVKRSSFCNKEIYSSHQHHHRLQHQKPPLKKNYYHCNNGNHQLKISPVLNVPTASLFGLGSIFSKEKNKKK